MTFGLGNRCSIRLSYGTKLLIDGVFCLGAALIKACCYPKCYPKPLLRASEAHFGASPSLVKPDCRVALHCLGDVRVKIDGGRDAGGAMREIG